MKVTGSEGGHPDKLSPIGGPMRLDVHRFIMRQLSHLAGGYIELLKLQSIVSITNERDALAIGGPIGLVVVAGPGGELLGSG